MTAQGNIYGINGPIIYLKGDSGFQMNEMVYVGTGRLVGEVIGLTSERTTIEVYEETTGLKPGEPVTGTGAPVSATLAPGILTSIFDGIERALKRHPEGKRLLHRPGHPRGFPGYKKEMARPYDS